MAEGQTDGQVIRAVASLLLLPACGTIMYAGETRPDHEVATIVAVGTNVTRIDERETNQLGGAFVVLLGTHFVRASLSDRGRFSYHDQAVCFEAEPGRIYRTRPRYFAQRWELEIIDDDSDELVAARHVDTAATDCSEYEPVPLSVAAAVPPVPAPRPAPRPVEAPGRLILKAPLLLAGANEVSAGDETAVETGSAPESAGDAPETAAAPTAAAPVAPAAAPAGAVRAQPSPPRPMHRPGTGFGFLFGGALGGDEILRGYYTDGSTDTMRAGSGPFIGLTASWTPIWLWQRLGLGATAGIGFKFNVLGDDDNNVYLTRFPADVSLQALLALEQRWYLVLRGGIQKDLRVHLDGKGFASPVDVFPTARPGALGEGGLLWHGTSGSGIGLTFRYSAVSYEAGGVSVDASSVAFLMALYLYL